MLTDQQKSEIAEMAKRYRGVVRRGDASAAWAAEDCAARYTYPYAETPHFLAVRSYASKFVK